MDKAMDLTKENLDYITEYVRNKLKLVPDSYARHEDVRILQMELKHQRELMVEGFKQTQRQIEQVDKRIEQIDQQFNKRFEQVDKQLDKRFEQVDKRLEQVDKHFDRMFKTMRWQFGFLATILMGLYLKILLHG